METRCRICGLLDALGTHHHNKTCYMCRQAYVRFRNDPGWGYTHKGGLRLTGGVLVDEPVRRILNVPSGTWFRYIVRERLLQGYCRYPYTSHHAREANIHWDPDKMPPWNDVHMAPHDFHRIPVKQAVALHVAEVPHTETTEPLGYIGPWGPPQ